MKTNYRVAYEMSYIVLPTMVSVKIKCVQNPGA